METEKTVRPAPKTPRDSESFIAEIVGEESQIGQRMSAGKLLHMMDMAAAGAAARHAECPMVTLAFDRIELLDFVCHMDYVRYDACVIQTGSSSMVIEVDGSVKPPTEMEIRPGHKGFITMVAIDKNGRINKNIPGLVYESEADLKKKETAESRACLIRERKKEMEAIDEMEKITDDLLVDFYPRNSFFEPEATRLKIRKIFLPRNTNRLGIVFGGDTIEMMEELALATARQFTGNFRMVTIAMEDVIFLKPLNLDNLVEMSSKVVFVANTTLVVEVTVRAIDFFPGGKDHITNKGIFTILNYDRSGRKKSIGSGLNLNNSDETIRKRYLKEQIRYGNRTGISPTFDAKCSV